jgi:hypothetical protein
VNDRTLVDMSCIVHCKAVVTGHDCGVHIKLFVQETHVTHDRNNASHRQCVTMCLGGGQYMVWDCTHPMGQVHSPFSMSHGINSIPRDKITLQHICPKGCHSSHGINILTRSCPMGWVISHGAIPVAPTLSHGISNIPRDHSCCTDIVPWDGQHPMGPFLLHKHCPMG